jgi:hypothetical protein
LVRTSDLLYIKKSSSATRGGSGRSSALTLGGDGVLHNSDGLQSHEEPQPSLQMHRLADKLQ